LVHASPTLEHSSAKLFGSGAVHPTNTASGQPKAGVSGLGVENEAAVDDAIIPPAVVENEAAVDAVTVDEPDAKSVLPIPNPVLPVPVAPVAKSVLPIPNPVLPVPVAVAPVAKSVLPIPNPVLPVPVAPVDKEDEVAEVVMVSSPLVAVGNDETIPPPVEVGNVDDAVGNMDDMPPLVGIGVANDEGGVGILIPCIFLNQNKSSSSRTPSSLLFRLTPPRSFFDACTVDVVAVRMEMTAMTWIVFFIVLCFVLVVFSGVKV